MVRNSLDELLGVWRETRLIVLVAQTAAIYAAVLIPFKVGIPLIPGFAELRPANALPVVASLLFGPVAAWGAGFGNLIGDCFGTLSPASLFGFLGNFCYGYVPYLLWGRLGPLSSGLDPEPRSWRQALEFVLVCLAASLVCAVVIAWGVDLLGLVPFGILATAIFFNNFVMAVLLAPPLLFFLTPRVARWGLRYEDIRASLANSSPSPRAPSPEPRPCPDSPSPRSFVEMRDVSFTYRGSAGRALDGVTLSVNRGESVVFMGRSGAGKSTLCYVLNGLIPHLIPGQWSGQVTVNDSDTRHQPVWQQAGTVGVLFQDFEAQLVSTDIEMELAFPLEHSTHPAHQLTPTEMRDRIARMLALVGLSGLERRDPRSLSGGQRQRLVIASILIRQPALIAMDEPLTDLDPEGRRTLAALLAELKQSGTTLIIAEHDSEEAVLADRLCLLEQGRVLWDGKPRAMFGDPAGKTSADKFGISALPMAQCFEGQGLAELPLTVEEAWQAADELGVVLSASPGTLPVIERRVIIDVQKVCYEYDRGRPALADVGLTIGDGEFVAIVGQNGSGKSTLAGLLNGLRNPTRGCIMVQGQDTRRLTTGQLAAAVGYVFQNPDDQIFAETVEREVAFGVRNLGCRREECDQRVAAALEAVGLDSPEMRNLDPFSLTKGDRQRVAVASVLAARPGILIFDEPTTGLDAQETGRMMQMLRRLNQEGHTIIIITHALSLVAAYAHRCVVMRDGRIHADGPTRQVFTRLLDPEVAASTGLQVPQLTRFAARWGQTLLTVEEVRCAMRRT